jgi:glucokinase
MNDAKACALAEWLHGAGRGYRHLAFLTAGTGMGSGLILDGRLYLGAGNVGEVGHMRLAPDGPPGYGKRGSFEGFCSGGGIGRWAQEWLQERGGLPLGSDATTVEKSRLLMWAQQRTGAMPTQ